MYTAVVQAKITGIWYVMHDSLKYTSIKTLQAKAVMHIIHLDIFELFLNPAINIRKSMKLPYVDFSRK